MLAQGDGYNEGWSTTSGVSNHTGYGHVHMHYPTNDGNIVAPWGWGTDVFAIHDGDTHLIRWGVIPAGATQWKMALLWDETRMDGAADIDVSVETLGQGNCNQVPQTLAYQNDFDLHQRLALTASQVANQCLQIRVQGYNVPPAGRTVYSVSYYHGGAID